MRLVLLLLLAARAGADNRVAAAAPREDRRIPVVAALLTESAKLYPGGFHAGFLVGTELPWKLRRGDALVQTVNLSYYHHDDLADALLLSTELGYRHTFRVGAVIELLLGVGYHHSFYSAYRLENGRYVRDGSGAPAFFPSLALGLGWDFMKLARPKPVAIFARYQLGFEVPGPYGVPAYPHTQVLAGVRVPLARFPIRPSP
jgi:hypothetical protein